MALACRYDADTDAILCWSVPTYGPQHWALPALEIAFPRDPDRFKYFARFLLEGLVCPALAAFVVRISHEQHRRGTLPRGVWRTQLMIGGGCGTISMGLRCRSRTL